MWHWLLRLMSMSTGMCAITVGLGVECRQVAPTQRLCTVGRITICGLTAVQWKLSPVHHLCAIGAVMWGRKITGVAAVR